MNNVEKNNIQSSEEAAGEWKAKLYRARKFN